MILAVIVVLSLLLLFSFLKVGKFYWTKRRLRLIESHKPTSSTTVEGNSGERRGATNPFSTNDDLERGLRDPTARRGDVTRGEDVEGDGSPAYSKEKGEGEMVLAVGAHVKAAVNPPVPLIEEQRSGTG